MRLCSQMPTETPTTPSRSAATTASRAARSGNKLREDDGRLVRGRRSRAKIHQAALTLFRERGFDGATLRAIAAEAGMGASSIYRHVRSKEELLIDELADQQEEAWRTFRRQSPRDHSTHQRLSHFLDVQHALLAADPDLTMIALRAITRREARVAKRVLALNDRTIGLLAEILQMGRKQKDLKPDLDILEASRALFHITLGARISWANGMMTAEKCRKSIQIGVDLMFAGIGR